MLTLPETVLFVASIMISKIWHLTLQRLVLNFSYFSSGNSCMIHSCLNCTFERFPYFNVSIPDYNDHGQDLQGEPTQDPVTCSQASRFVRQIAVLSRQKSDQCRKQEIILLSIFTIPMSKNESKLLTWKASRPGPALSAGSSYLHWSPDPPLSVLEFLYFNQKRTTTDNSRASK